MTKNSCWRVEFVLARGADPAMVLRYVDLILDLCHQRGLKFMALALVTRARAHPIADDPYRTGLAAVFRRRGVPVFDLIAQVTAALGTDAVPEGEFDGIFHLKPDATSIGMMVDWILANRDAAPVPPALDPPPVQPIVASDFTGPCRTLTLSNSLGQFRATARRPTRRSD